MCLYFFALVEFNTIEVVSFLLKTAKQLYALAITEFREQYGQYFPRFCYFSNLNNRKHEKPGKS